MFARIAVEYTRLRPWLHRLFRGSIFLVGIGCLFLLMELMVWPWIMTQDTLKRLGWIPALSERMTVIERRETVTVTQDENFERLLMEQKSIVARITATPLRVPTTVTERLKTAQFFTATFVTNDGLLVTYLDQLPPATVQYQVEWAGSTYGATVVGYDTLTQLAFFRIDRDNTPAVAFTNTRDLKPGRRLALLGTALDGGFLISPTLVEQHDRIFNLAPQTVASSEKWEGVLGLPLVPDDQYLGGPALLTNGELAGIVGTRKLDGQTEAFLLPAEVVRLALERMLSAQPERPVAGIYYRSLTPAYARILDLKEERGAIVYSPSERTGLSVIAGSPAAQAGVRFGDIIVAVNDVEINLDVPLSVALGRLSVGDRAILKVIRDGVEQEIVLSLW